METLLGALSSCLFWGLGSCRKRLSMGKEQACCFCPMWWCVTQRWQRKASGPQSWGSTQNWSIVRNQEYFSLRKRSFVSGTWCFSEGRCWCSAGLFRPALKCVFMECFMQALERSLCGFVLDSRCFFVSTVAVKFFTYSQKLKERRFDFIAQSTSAKCFFPCSRHIAFGGNTGSWLRAVEELSQGSVMLRVSVLLPVITWQRCCFHLLGGWGRLDVT